MSEEQYQDGGNLLATSHRVHSEELRIAEYLKEIRDGQLYTEDGYETFAAFCEGEFGMPVRTALGLIGSLGASQASLN